jgi:hypothetical protein
VSLTLPTAGLRLGARAGEPAVVDPEALLIGTAAVGDARIADVALGWSKTHRHLLSRARAKQLLDRWPEAIGWPEFAARLTLATEQRWPGAGGAMSAVWTPQDEQHLPITPASLTLRIRSAFGVSARSEVVSMFLRRPDGAHASAGDLTAEGAYSKRNLSNALVALEQAGLLRRRARANIDQFYLADARALRSVFTPAIPDSYRLMWWLRAAWVLASGLDAIANAPAAIRSVEARAVLTKAEEDASMVSDTPNVAPETDAWKPVRDWAESFIGSPATLGDHRCLILLRSWTSR